MTDGRRKPVNDGVRDQGSGIGKRRSADSRPVVPDLGHGSAPDRVFIRDLALRCIVGVDDEERREKQDVLIQITLHTALPQAGRSDALQDTADYRALKERIIRLVEKSHFYLIEALAQSIADECLRDRRVAQVQVTVEKAGALRFARTAGVQIVRSRAE